MIDDSTAAVYIVLRGLFAFSEILLIDEAVRPRGYLFVLMTVRDVD